jgi:outer membrane protein TolC
MDTLKERESEALNQAVEISRDLFLGGKATYLEVLSAQRDALDANRESIQIKKMRMASNIHLYKALGGGWR